VGYVGLYDQCLDEPLVLKTADSLPDGGVHLVGPDSQSEVTRAIPASNAFQLLGSERDLPSWLISFDVLICRHLVTEFTLSLDAIKACEYLAIQPPLVATPTSGIQNPSISGLLIETDGFANAVELGTRQRDTLQRQVQDGDDQARQFAAALTEPSRRG
jgi:hypothetical protein